MRRTSIFLVALPLLGGCAATQQGLADLAAAANTSAAGAASGATLGEAAAKAQGFRAGQMVGGTISSPGEIDEFKLEGTKGQELVVYASAPARIQNEGSGWQSNFYFGIETPEGSPVGVPDKHGLAFEISKGQPLEESYSSTIRLPSTGTYTVRVGGRSPTARGPYRFVLRPRQ